MLFSSCCLVFNITDFYHHDLMHPLKFLHTSLSGAPQKCFKSDPALANARHAGSVSENAATESLFAVKLSSSNVKAVTLTRAPENEGEIKTLAWKQLSHSDNFHTHPGYIDRFFSWCFCL